MRLGICTSPDHLAVAKEAGYDFAELGCPFLIPEQDESAFAPVRRSLLAAGIPVEVFNVFLPGHLHVTGPEVDRAALAKHMDTVLRRAKEVGASVIVYGSGRSRKVPEGFPLEQAKVQFTDSCRLAAETADKHGMTIALEPLLKRACNFFNLTSQGIAYVDAVNHPRCRLLTDLYHMAWEQEPFEHLVDAGPRLAHIHLATPILPETGTDNGPGYDIPRFLGMLKKAGYDGRLSVEDNPGFIAKAPKPMPEVYAVIARHVREAWARA